MESHHMVSLLLIAQSQLMFFKGPYKLFVRSQSMLWLILLFIRIGLARKFVPSQSQDDLVVVTGASSNHFHVLLEFLEKYDKFGYLNERPVPLIIYDLGLSDDEKRNLPEKAYAKHQLLPFPYHIYPSFWKIEIDAGKYGWKAGIMAEVFKAQRRSVLWLDSGVSVSPSLDRLAAEMKQHGFVTTNTPGTIAQWVHRGTLQYLLGSERTTKVSTDNPMCNGAVIGISFGHPVAHLELFRRYLECAELAPCIAPLGSSRSNHRQDQAVLTVLAHSLNYSTSCAVPPATLGVTCHASTYEPRALEISEVSGPAGGRKGKWRKRARTKLGPMGPTGRSRHDRGVD